MPPGQSKIVGIVQARLGSTRLPGKVLKDLEGRTVLDRVVSRLRRVPLMNELIVATSDLPADDAIADECAHLQCMVFRGSEGDVLDRYFRAAQSCEADIVVRITSDCPLIDPEITNASIAKFLEVHPDYASNSLVRTYPRGLDTEVMTMQTIECAWREAREPHQRAHVTPYIYQNPDRFKLLSVTGEIDYSDHRWTLDTQEDLELIRAIYRRLEPGDRSWRDVLAILEAEPELMELNRMIAQKAMHEC